MANNKEHTADLTINSEKVGTTSEDKAEWDDAALVKMYSKAVSKECDKTSGQLDKKDWQSLRTDLLQMCQGMDQLNVEKQTLMSKLMEQTALKTELSTTFADLQSQLQSYRQLDDEYTSITTDFDEIESSLHTSIALNEKSTVQRGVDQYTSHGH